MSILDKIRWLFVNPPPGAVVTYRVDSPRSNLAENPHFLLVGVKIVRNATSIASAS
jgi:hypothetical protein